MTRLDEFNEKIEAFLSDLLPLSFENPFSKKIIHDSIWGTNSFYSWEVGLIDSPLLQRLRRIHQTGPAYLVYPTATHTRFEHSLGVAALVEKLITHLNENTRRPIPQKDRLTLRLTALLHDVGHSFFSHVSELVYDRFPEFQELKLEIFSTYGVKPKNHEIMSFLIVKSDYFKHYFQQILTKIDADSKSHHLNYIDLDEVAGYIIGYSKKKDKKYLADIINGPIDCDKLDYLARDAKFAGPIIAYDIDRFLYTINIYSSKKIKRLTVSLAGINVIEQLIVSKMMMYSYVYHHHKVRAIEAMVKRFCFDIKKDAISSSGRISIRLDHPVDFLKYTDEVILSSFIEQYDNSSEVKQFISSILQRRLWVRAQMISCFNTNLNILPIPFLQLERDIHLKENIDKLNDIKQKIIDRVKKLNPGNPIRRRDIWIDVPFPPSSDEPKQIKVKKRSNLNQVIQLSDVFPLEQWVDAYKTSKLRAHIFCARRFQSVVYTASSEILKEVYNIRPKPFTKDFCKIS